jgi:hypothetical protein
MRRPLFTARKIPDTHFCQKLSRPQGHSAARRIRSAEKFSDLIGNGTCDLPACSIVPQSTTLPHAPTFQTYECLSYAHIVGLHSHKVILNSSSALITVAARSTALTVFARSNTGVVGSNPARGMDVCVLLFCVCVVCIGSGLATD